ncbi:MAG TPA: hypothetical protein VFS52_10965 [Steroidobacteraceae bacterium]|jgi:hypothetical protein|nr:hypothetical protein [Steroidobacteraceae bacterium]
MQPLYPPAGPQTIGQALDSGFRIFQVSLVKCLLYGAVSMIAGQLPNIYFIAIGRPLTPFGGGDPLWIALYIVGAAITLIMYAALLLRQHGIATGQPLGTRAELATAARKLPAYLALIVLSILIMMIGPLLIGIAAGLFGGLASQNYALLAILGLIAAVPVMYVATPLALGPPALLLDGKGPVRAIDYVLRLIRGNWWRATAIFTVALVLIIVFYGVAMVIVGMVLPLAGATDVAAVTAATGVVYVVLGSIGLPFLSAIVLATYGDLKVRKEGVDLEKKVASVVS